MLFARVEENQAAPPLGTCWFDEHRIAVLGDIDGYQKRASRNSIGLGHEDHLPNEFGRLTF